MEGGKRIVKSPRLIISTLVFRCKFVDLFELPLFGYPCLSFRPELIGDATETLLERHPRIRLLLFGVLFLVCLPPVLPSGDSLRRG